MPRRSFPRSFKFNVFIIRLYAAIINTQGPVYKLKPFFPHLRIQKRSPCSSTISACSGKHFGTWKK
ncbi:MAG: hypothetical protein DBY09_06190 [Selenomonadales bacterium]|nr:MAG: hypothetical protein DBY09_06190 [Selenomonadales bacterium]